MTSALAMEIEPENLAAQMREADPAFDMVAQSLGLSDDQLNSGLTLEELGIHTNYPLIPPEWFGKDPAELRELLAESKLIGGGLEADEIDELAGKAAQVIHEIEQTYHSAHAFAVHLPRFARRIRQAWRGDEARAADLHDLSEAVDGADIADGTDIMYDLSEHGDSFLDLITHSTDALMAKLKTASAAADVIPGVKHIKGVAGFVHKHPVISSSVGIIIDHGLLVGLRRQANRQMDIHRREAFACAAAYYERVKDATEPEEKALTQEESRAFETLYRFMSENYSSQILRRTAMRDVGNIAGLVSAPAAVTNLVVTKLMMGTEVPTEKEFNRRVWDFNLRGALAVGGSVVIGSAVATPVAGVLAGKVTALSYAAANATLYRLHGLVKAWDKLGTDAVEQQKFMQDTGRMAARVMAASPEKYEEEAIRAHERKLAEKALEAVSSGQGRYNPQHITTLLHYLDKTRYWLGLGIAIAELNAEEMEQAMERAAEGKLLPSEKLLIDVIDQHIKPNAQLLIRAAQEYVVKVGSPARA